MSEINDCIRLRSRVEFSEYLFHRRSEQGFLMFHEIKYSKLGKKWSLLGRFTLFDTESYDSRIYAYEQDVQGVFAIPAFSGKGSKLIAVYRMKLNKLLTFSFKVAHLIYDDRLTISGGNDEIEGPVKTELTCQIEAKF